MTDCCRLGLPLSLLPGKLELVLLSFKQFNFGFSWGGMVRNDAIQSNKQHLHWVCAGVQSTQFAISIVPFEIFLCRPINYWCHKKLQQIKLKISLEARTWLDLFSSPTIKMTSNQWQHKYYITLYYLFLFYKFILAFKSQNHRYIYTVVYNPSYTFDDSHFYAQHDNFWSESSLLTSVHWWRDPGQKKQEQLWNVQSHLLVSNTAKWLHGTLCYRKDRIVFHNA